MFVVERSCPAVTSGWGDTDQHDPENLIGTTSYQVSCGYEPGDNSVLFTNEANTES